MSRRKAPSGETEQQTESRRILESIANHATRSEKMSWDRKMDNMVALIAKLRPLENQMLAIMAQKQPILDDIAVLRGNMIRECIHPFDHLVLHENNILCKFCGKRLGLPNGQKK